MQEQGILRASVTDTFVAGDTVFYEETDDAHDVYISKDHHGCIIGCVTEKDNILPVNEYLRRRPKQDFLTLSKVSRYENRDPHTVIDPHGSIAKFLTDPALRFESIGEIIHFLRINNLNKKDYIVVQYLWLENLI
jgi:hypothetical protein